MYKRQLWTVAWGEDDGGLYRHDESGTQEWSLADLGLSGMADWYLQEYLVAPDGSLWADWLASEAGCTGVIRFDGLGLQRYLLPGMAAGDFCLDGMDIAPDGSVWLMTEVDLYVITPEAVAATE